MDDKPVASDIQSPVTRRLKITSTGSGVVSRNGKVTGTGSVMVNTEPPAVSEAKIKVLEETARVVSDARAAAQAAPPAPRPPQPRGRPKDPGRTLLMAEYSKLLADHLSPREIAARLDAKKKLYNPWPVTFIEKVKSDPEGFAKYFSKK